MVAGRLHFNCSPFTWLDCGPMNGFNKIMMRHSIRVLAGGLICLLILVMGIMRKCVREHLE